MPLAIKLSKRFYDTLGDEVTNEFVMMLNSLDDAYRTEIRDLFGSHTGQIDSRMGQLEGRMDRLEGRMERLEGRMERLEGRMGQLETRLVRVEAQIELLEKNLNTRIDAKLSDLKASILTWTLVFWLGTMGTVVALLKL